MPLDLKPCNSKTLDQSFNKEGFPQKQSCPECRMSDRFSNVRREFESTVTGEGEGQNAVQQEEAREEGGARSTESFTQKNYFLPKIKITTITIFKSVMNIEA